MSCFAINIVSKGTDGKEYAMIYKKCGFELGKVRIGKGEHITKEVRKAKIIQS